MPGDSMRTSSTMPTILWFLAEHRQQPCGAAVESLMKRLKLTVNVEKTRCCRVPEEPVEFLGYRIGRNYRRDTGRAYIGTRPSQASVHLAHVKLQSIGRVTLLGARRR